MTIKEATILERHILRVMPTWKPEVKRLGNGEPVVTLVIGNWVKYVWDVRDWNKTFALPNHKLQEEQEEVMV
jgi:hypothetical protein